MSLPVYTRFSVADYPTAPNWLATFFVPLNQTLEGIVKELNNNITIGSNLQGQYFQSSFTTSSAYATGTFTPLTFQYTGGGRPTGLFLAYIGRADNTKILTATSINGWTLNVNVKPYTITVPYIAGLAPSIAYKATFLAL